MTLYYVDPAATGANDGTSWTDAWTSAQTAFDTVTVGTGGNIIYARGTQTLTVTIDVNTYEGDLTYGYIKFIGCAADGSVDGTRFVFNGNNAATYCVYNNSMNFIWFENCEFKNAVEDGFRHNSVAYGVCVNCYSHTNGDDGFRGTGGSLPTFILCRAENNTENGHGYPGAYSRMIFCVGSGNTLQGFAGWTDMNNGVVYGCLSHNNANGFLNVDSNISFLNNIIDNETIGIEFDDNGALLVGNRITNCTTGIDFNTKVAVAGWNYFNNTTEVADATLAYNIPYREALTNALMSAGIDGSNIDTGTDGYNDRANDDFNLTTSATLRRTAIDLEIGS